MPAYDGTAFDPPAPLAKVTLRDPHSGRTVSDVAMLIDCGADVTLLPEASITRLGANVNSAETFELMAFDGSVTDAPAVMAEMLFLRRNFKGQFLLIKEECGVIGRDVLNHLSILLDGPRLNWDEA